MSAHTALFETSIRSLRLLARGKVRDNYEVGNDRLLMVASDRISAFDVVMDDPIPGKGQILTKMALWWFEQLSSICPNHLTGESPQSVVAPDEVSQVVGRSMLVKRLEPVLVEAVVRGYLAGSGWSQYQSSQSVCGVALPAGLRNASRLPEPIFTPAAKAQMGDHDENITFEQTVSICGLKLAEQIRDTSLALYKRAAQLAQSKGILIADTKFEFGLDSAGTLVLMDEVLTPDSSRYWPAHLWQEGGNPPSYDKQYLRDWLQSAQVGAGPWLKRPPPPKLPPEIIEATRLRYEEALKCLVGS